MSPKTYSFVFRVLYGATYLSRDSSEKALELLNQTEFTEGIVVGVPDNLPVAHKYGARTTQIAAKTNPKEEIKELHDCGIVYYPNHPYLLCVMTQGYDFKTLSNLIKEISSISYEELSRFFKS